MNWDVAEAEEKFTYNTQNLLDMNYSEGPGRIVCTEHCASGYGSRDGGEWKAGLEKRVGVTVKGIGKNVSGIRQ